MPRFDEFVKNVVALMNMVVIYKKTFKI